jgi:hypothetical protein
MVWDRGEYEDLTGIQPPLFTRANSARDQAQGRMDLGQRSPRRRQ